MEIDPRSVVDAVARHRYDPRLAAFKRVTAIDAHAPR
jgi:hypothetical protein